MSLGYLVPEFPGQTHAFFWREIQAIEETGMPVRIYSTRRPPSGSCPHVFASDAGAFFLFLGGLADLMSFFCIIHGHGHLS